MPNMHLPSLHWLPVKAPEVTVGVSSGSTEHRACAESRQVSRKQGSLPAREKPQTRAAGPPSGTEKKGSQQQQQPTWGTVVRSEKTDKLENSATEGEKSVEQM